MKKSEQLKINLEVVAECEKALAEWANFGCVHYISKLRSCQADVFSTPTYIILRSYKTVICAINRINGNTYDFLRYEYGYTATSAQHISKFISDYGTKYGSGKIYRYYPLAG